MKKNHNEERFNSKIKNIFENCKNEEIFIKAKSFASFENIPVLLLGETGTGKEIITRYIQQNSPRKEKPFYSINTSAIPKNLVSSELFGHKKGAFTDAKEDKKGILEMADGGTAFLDEIGDISFEVQVALLRFLDSGEIRPVGSNETKTVDVRIIAATNANLPKKIKVGKFREDLYYRLSSSIINIKPLREKQKYEIKRTLDFIITEVARENNLPDLKLSDEAWDSLLNYSFKGNYREARNIIERFYITGKRLINADDITLLTDEQIESSNYENNNEFHNEIKFDVNERVLTLSDFSIEELTALKFNDTLNKHHGVIKSATIELEKDFKTMKKYLKIYKQIGKIPDVIRINPTSDWKNSNPNLKNK